MVKHVIVSDARNGVFSDLPVCVYHECFGLGIDLFYGGRTQVLTAVFLEV